MGLFAVPWFWLLLIQNVELAIAVPTNRYGMIKNLKQFFFPIFLQDIAMSPIP